jgi:hypothetical protein
MVEVWPSSLFPDDLWRARPPWPLGKFASEGRPSTAEEVVAAKSGGVPVGSGGCTMGACDGAWRGGGGDDGHGRLEHHRRLLRLVWIDGGSGDRCGGAGWSRRCEAGVDSGWPWWVVVVAGRGISCGWSWSAGCGHGWAVAGRLAVAVARCGRWDVAACG